jgi:hypothetical protein
VTALLLLFGCGGPPEGIPDSPGTITAAELPNLATIGSPDLPWLAWETMVTFETEEWRDCPQVFLRADGLNVTADGCVDSTGVTWYGTASYTINAAEASAVVSMNDFGADDGTGGWTMDGTVRIDEVSTGYLLTMTASVVSLAGDTSYLMWADTETALAEYDGVTYADRITGTVGLQGWGTSDVEGLTLPIALAGGCTYGAHPAGTLLFRGSGDNAGFLAYSDLSSAGGDTDAASAKGVDTGDTAAPADTGTDTGADTGADTGGTDTGATDTADTGDTGTSETTDLTCNACPDGRVDGVLLDACVTVERLLDSPFPAPF